MKAKSFFPANDWFDLNFYGSFLPSEQEIKTQLNEKKYSLSEQQISSRLLNYYYQNEIIEDDRPNRKGWRKFSISELIWLQIVLKLRAFGLDLPKIKKVKDCIDSYGSDKISKCPLLDFYIVVATESEIPIKFIVFESGHAHIVRQNEIDAGAQFGFITEDYILIDLNKLLNQFFKKKNIRTDYFTYNNFSITKEIESTLIKGDFSSITIKVKEKEYVLKKEVILQDKQQAKAAASLVKYGQLIEHKYGKDSHYKVISEKKIKKG